MKIKKIIALSLAVLCLTLAACSSAPAIVLHETLPWSVDGAAIKEQSTYRITRYLGNCDDLEKLPDSAADKPLIITHAASYVTYTLYEGYGVRLVNGKVTPFKDDSTKGLSLLTMTLKVWYLDEDYVPERYRLNTLEKNMPETIISCAVFDRYNMSARFTYRETNLVQQKGEDLNHKMWVDYTGGVLDKRIAKIQYWPYDDNSPAKESSIKSGEYFDNEYLYYYMRALKSTDGNADSSLTFNFSLPYENLLNGKKVTSRSLTAATSKDDVVLSPNVLNETEFNALYGLFNLDAMPAEQKNDEENKGKYKICSYTALRLNEKKSGPDIKLYYSRYPVREDREKLQKPLFKLLMQVKTYTYGFTTNEKGSSYFDTNNPQYSQVFQLLNYSQHDRDIGEPGVIQI